MSNLIVILFSFILSAIISFLWVRGIDNMKKNHPDYKGEDFLNDIKQVEHNEKKEEKQEKQ